MELGPEHTRAEVHAEIEAIFKVKDDRPDVPIPTVGATGPHKNDEHYPQRNLISTQSSFPINSVRPFDSLGQQNGRRDPTAQHL